MFYDIELAMKSRLCKIVRGGIPILDSFELADFVSGEPIQIKLFFTHADIMDIVSQKAKVNLHWLVAVLVARAKVNAAQRELASQAFGEIAGALHGYAPVPGSLLQMRVADSRIPEPQEGIFQLPLGFSATRVIQMAS